MKKGILLILLSIFSYQLNAQNNGKEVVLIKVYEGYKGCNVFTRIIIYDKETKVVNLEKYEAKGDELNENQQKIKEVLAEYINNGFTLNTSNSMTSSCQEITTYIFSK